MKIQFFALFLAAQSSLLLLDRAVAMDALADQPGDSSPLTEPFDVIQTNQSTLYEMSVAPVQPPVRPSFSAHYRLQHQPSKTVLDEAHVLFSETGMRVEQLIDQSGNVYIANHAEEKYWFVDRSRRVFHAIPVVVSHHAARSSDPSQPQPAAGFVQLSPCSGLEAQPDGTELWQGRPVQHWICRKLGEIVEEQWYAPIPGVVVRSQTHDGYVSELTDLRNRDFSPLDFQPPSHYRQVSIDELMNPSMPIGTYIE